MHNLFDMYRLKYQRLLYIKSNFKVLKFNFRFWKYYHYDSNCFNLTSARYYT
jgi:hypothetical protein